MNETWEASLSEWVSRRMPEADGAPLAELGEGDFCRAWALGTRWVVRVPKHEEATAALEREAALLERIAGRLPLPVPRPRFHPAAAEGGTALAIHDRIDGIELTRDVHMALEEPFRSEVPATLGRFLKALHAAPVSAGAEAGLPRVDHQAWIRSWAERTAPGSASPLPVDLQAELHTCFATWDARGPWHDEPAILHADLSPGHVLISLRDARVTGILDWGDAVLGDPARDFIFLYEDWSLDFLDRALAAYASPGEVAGLRSRVLLHYLADQLAWTLPDGSAGASADFRHGVASLRRGVLDFRASLD